MERPDKRSLADWKSTGEIVLAHTTDDQCRRLAVDLLNACDRVKELEARVKELDDLLMCHRRDIGVEPYPDERSKEES